MTNEITDLAWSATTNSNTGSGKQFNNNQEGRHNRQYNAESITINEGQQQGSDTVVNWLSSPSPWPNHNSAREQHESETGAWLLADPRYLRWKTDGSHLWLHGKAGSGKTVLCSTVIEDLRKQCEHKNHGLAIFYFSFSDNRKQSYSDLLRSLLVQLCVDGPAGCLLRQAQHKYGKDVPGIDDLERILYLAFSAYDTIYVALDALDECPKENNNRSSVLEHLERLAQRAPMLRLFATSRELIDIHYCMEALEADSIEMVDNTIDDDIRRYLSARLAQDYRLRRLKEKTKRVVADSIAEKSHGMFRYAHLQLQEIQNLDSHRPSKIQEVIDRLPVSIDESYTRVLVNIRESDRNDAITLLRWLVYAQAPLTLEQLVEVVVIQADRGTVDDEDRGDLEDVLNILSGLVTIVREDDSSTVDRYGNSVHSELVKPGSRITLAHYTVQEYLESTRILTQAAAYHLTQVSGHFHLMQGCVTYLQWYSNNTEKTSTRDDLKIFPLISYAARSWYHHAWLYENHLHHDYQQDDADVEMVTRYVCSKQKIVDWLQIKQPDLEYSNAFSSQVLSWPGMALYYASLLGLASVVKELLHQGHNPNVIGGHHGSALQAASYMGRSKVVRLLLDHGADPNAAFHGQYGTALCAAAKEHNTSVARMLLDRGAEINAEGGQLGTALECAAYSHGRSIDTMRLLLDRGADVHITGTSYYYASALQAAASIGHDEKVRLLLDAGADPNASGREHRGNALYLACGTNNTNTVNMLLDAGADINAQLGLLGNALESAIREGQVEVVQVLIQRGVDLDARTREFYGSALNAAVYENNIEIFQLLLAGGADIHRTVFQHGTVLHTAAAEGHIALTQKLIEAGVDVNAQAGVYGSVLCAAVAGGHLEIMQILLRQGADVHAPAGRFGSALQAAAETDHIEAAKLLLAYGADVNKQGGVDGNPLQAAAVHADGPIFAKFLLDHGADVNLDGGRYGSALEAAIENAHDDTTRLLIERGGRNDIGEKTPHVTEESFIVYENPFGQAMEKFAKDLEQVDFDND